jgi:hypothetical protein
MARATRRQFFRTALAAGGCATLAATSASAIEPIRRNKRPQFRLSLAAYSFRQSLNLKRQPKPTMTLADFIDLSAGLPLDAV